MANFFLIDHSLRQAGGHHFDYVRCVARASNEMGFLTTIGTHRTLGQLPPSDLESLDRIANVRRVFQQTTYQPDSYLAGLQHLTRSNSSSALLSATNGSRVLKAVNGIKNYRHRQRREKFVRRFASDCERFFRPKLQMPGDHVFLTTVSELELMGLAIYLSTHPKTLHSEWHLQFHFNLFDGRTPEYDGQSHITNAIRACFLAALARIPYHTLKFYTTSETLVDQYSRLGVGEFDVLPYPVSTDFSNDPQSDGIDFHQADIGRVIQKIESGGSLSTGFQPKVFYGNLDEAAEGMFSEEASAGPGFSESSQQDSEQPSVQLFSGDETFKRRLKVTCPGELRREKGHVEYLQPLINNIWDSHLSTGEVQIVVQRPQKKWHSKRPKIEMASPTGEVIPSGPNDPIQYYSHPLKHDEYVELIKSSDCGLLFYDSRVYFSRRAGVLGELLSCGKPVIVPAGSWLAEQVQGSIYEHVDTMVDQNEVVTRFDYRDFNWNSNNVPMPGGVLSFDQAQHPFEFEVKRENSESAFVMSFDWHWPKESGVYCRIGVTQLDADGNELAASSQVVGHRKSNRKVSSLFPLDSQASQIKFSLTNAFHHSTASISKVQLKGIKSLSGGSDLPRGAVGIIASDKDDLANCIDEIVRHFDHYRDSAQRFSKPWYARHRPTRTVEHLVSDEQVLRKVA